MHVSTNLSGHLANGSCLSTGKHVTRDFAGTMDYQ